MISVLRSRLKSHGYQLVLWMVILSMSGFLFTPFMRKEQGAGTIASINDTEIPQQALTRKIQETQEQISYIRHQFGGMADMILQSMGLTGDIREYALKQLISDTLVDELGKQLGIVVSPDTIMKKLQDPTFVAQELADVVPAYVFDQFGGINGDILDAHLRRSGISIDAFEKLIEQRIKRSLTYDLIAGAAYVPAFERNQRLIDEHAPKRYEILTLSFDDALKKVREEKVTDAQLKEFFTSENKKTHRYWVPEKRSGVVWTFNAQTYGLNISDKAIKAYYDKNKPEFLSAPAQVNVRRILVKLPADEAGKAAARKKIEFVQEELAKDAKKFVSLAQQHSDDKATAGKGGVVGFFKRGEKDKTFEQEAFSLKEAGDVSSVIETDDGLEILQLVERKKATFKSLESATKEIKEKLAGQRFKPAFSQGVRRLVNEIKESPQALNAFVTQRHGNKKVLSAVEKGADQNVDKLFKLKKDGDIGYVADQSVGHVIQLAKVEKAYEPKLDTIKDRVAEDWYDNQARLLVKRNLGKAHLLVKSGKSMADTKKDVGGSLKTTDWVTSEAKEFESLIKDGVPATALSSLGIVGALKQETNPKGTGYLVRLKAIDTLNEKEMAEKKQSIDRAMYAEGQAQSRDGFVASLYRNATIKLNQSLFYR